MTYPTIEEFKRMLLGETTLEEIALDLILSGMPFVFRDEPSNMDLLRNHLHNALGLPRDDIFIVGSAGIGFSLNPDRFPRRFSGSSDIDVLIINSNLFDDIWSTILKWHYPRKGQQLPGQDGPWMRSRRTDIYWGSFMPDRIRYRGLFLPDALKPLSEISRSWFEAFQSLSTYPEFSAREISGLLYRSLDNAILYQAEGLRKIRVQLSNRE